MKRVLKSKKLFEVIIEFNSIDSYISSIFADSEIDIVEEIIYNQMILTLKDVVNSTSDIIQHYGLIFDGLKVSPRNSEGIQESYYVYFHNPKDEDDNSIFIEVKLQISDHDYTTVDENGNIIVDVDRNRNHRAIGSMIDREELELKLKKNVVTVIPEEVKVADQTIENLHSALRKIRDIIKQFSE